MLKSCKCSTDDVAPEDSEEDDIDEEEDEEDEEGEEEDKEGEEEGPTIWATRVSLPLTLFLNTFLCSLLSVEA